MRYCALLVVGMIAPVLVAQEKTPAAVTLKLHPAAAPKPALKYQLLPPLRDLQPGNAAMFYHRAHSPEWFRTLEHQPWLGKMHEWLDMPAADMPQKEVRQVLAFNGIFKELEHAAHCETCNWQMSARLRDEGVMLLLPEVQGFRQFAQMLALKARLEMLDGRPEDAVRTLQTGFAFARHIGECPILINAMVAMAMTQTMLGTVEELVQRPGTPNLYWALRDLPDPFIDLRKPLQGDRLAVDGWWPDIRKALGERKFQPLSVATLRANLGANMNKLHAYGRNEVRIEVATVVALTHPHAMTYFRGLGHTQEELDALPVTQVALMFALAQWDQWYDAVYRWHNVPYWQARAGLKKAAEEREQSLRGQREGLLLPQYLLPMNEQIFGARARVQRRLAALQCVEAIRLHAAAHDGQLPDALGDIRDVPIPIDPVTGNPFVFTNEGSFARLYGPPLSGESVNDRTALVYQISIIRR